MNLSALVRDAIRNHVRTVEKNLKRKTVALAKRDGQSISALVRIALNRYIDAKDAENSQR